MHRRRHGCRRALREGVDSTTGDIPLPHSGDESGMSPVGVAPHMRSRNGPSGFVRAALFHCGFHHADVCCGPSRGEAENHAPSTRGHPRSGTLARGGFPSATLATSARSLPVPLVGIGPRSTGRFVEPPASPRVPSSFAAGVCAPDPRAPAQQGATPERSPPPTKSPGAAVYRCGWGRPRSKTCTRTRGVTHQARLLRDEASPPRGGPVGEALERWDKEGDECKRKRGSSFCILYTR